MEEKNKKLIEISSLFLILIVLIPIFVMLLIVSVPKEILDEITYEIPIFDLNWSLQKDMHLVFVVVYAGALGGLIHGLSSLAHHARENDFQPNFVYWYISRPFLGAALALAVYFAFRGGIISDTNIDILNPYGVAAISIVVGLGSKKITDKLRDLFDTLLK